MGISARPYPGVVVRTGAERATLVRRKYTWHAVAEQMTEVYARLRRTQPKSLAAASVNASVGALEKLLGASSRA